MTLGRYTTTASEQGWCGVPGDGGTVINLPEAGAGADIDIPRRSTDLLAGWQWRRRAELAVEFAEETGTAIYDVDEVDRLAPVTDPEKVVCVGLNYRDHAEEGDNPIPETPVLFSKFPTCVTGPGSAMTWVPGVHREGRLRGGTGRRNRP
jgi:2-keto-4-pentenoate hydratase/2-oxohepta-3-ene-1,7-dioic acid hydratase in catechol pathway